MGGVLYAGAALSSSLAAGASRKQPSDERRRTSSTRNPLIGMPTLGGLLPMREEEDDGSDAFEERVRLGSKVRYDLLSDEEQKEWRTEVVHRSTDALRRALKLSEDAKAQKQQQGEVATQQALAAKELAQREAEVAEAKEMLEVPVFECWRHVVAAEGSSCVRCVAKVSVLLLC